MKFMHRALALARLRFGSAPARPPDPAPDPVPFVPASRSDVLPPLLALHLFLLLFIFPARFLDPWMGQEWIYAEVRVHFLAQLLAEGGPLHAPWLPQVARGYGWPFFTYYSPLGYYAALPFIALFGASSTQATTLSFLAALIASAWTMVALALELARDLAPRRRHAWAAAAAVLFVAAPFHIMDIFIRKGLASAWAWAALAGVLYGVERTRRDPLRGLALTSLMSALLILSHNITAFYGALFIAAYALLTTRSLRTLSWLILGALGGLLLSAWFWVPVAALKSLVHAGSVNEMWGHPLTLKKHAVDVLFLLRETYNPYGAPHLGLVIVAGVLPAAFATLSRRLGPLSRRRAAAALILFLAAAFAITPHMPWSLLPSAFGYVQFPWRLLTFTTLFGVMALLSAAPWIDRWLHPAVPGGMAALVGLVALPACFVAFDPPLTDGNLLPQYAAIENTGFYFGCAQLDYLPKSVEPRYWQAADLNRNPPPPHRLEALDGELSILEFRRTAAEYRYAYEAPAPIRVRMHVYDFPDWKARLDDADDAVILDTSPEGLVSATLPAGRHTWTVFYDSPPIAKSMQALSLGTFMAWTALAAWAFAGAFLRALLRRLLRTLRFPPTPTPAH